MKEPSQNPAGELYVYRIDELREEIGRAMAAISSNRLQALEESLWRQEVLCTGLKRLLGPLHGQAPGNALSERLQTSIGALHQVNRSYAALLQQAQLSNHLLYTLCQGYSLHACEPVSSVDTGCSLEA